MCARRGPGRFGYPRKSVVSQRDLHGPRTAPVQARKTLHGRLSGIGRGQNRLLLTEGDALSIVGRVPKEATRYN